jgi:hypothetical protein
MKPSYMAIKKALYGRQPGVFVLFMFSFVLLLLQEKFLFCALAVAREFVLVCSL